MCRLPYAVTARDFIFSTGTNGQTKALVGFCRSCVAALPNRFLPIVGVCGFPTTGAVVPANAPPLDTEQNVGHAERNVAAIQNRAQRVDLPNVLVLHDDLLCNQQVAVLDLFGLG